METRQFPKFNVIPDGEHDPNALPVEDDECGMQPTTHLSSAIPYFCNPQEKFLQWTGAQMPGIINYDDCSAFPDPELKRAMLNQAASTLFDPIKDARRTMRQTFITTWNGEYCLCRTYNAENTKPVIKRLWNGSVTNAMVAKFQGKLFVQLSFSVNGTVKLGSFYPLDDLKSSKNTEFILGECLELVEQAGTKPEFLALIRNQILQLVNTYKPEEYMHLGFCHLNQRFSFSKAIPKEILEKSGIKYRLSLVDQQNEINTPDLIRLTLNSYKAISSEENASMIFLFSFIGLFYSLMELERCDTFISLLGDTYSCRKVACHFIKSYSRNGDDDFINIANTSIHDIRRYLSVLRDDVAVFIMEDFNGYQLKKLENLLSFLANGQCGGDKIYAPFVFCSKNLLPLGTNRCLFIKIENYPESVLQDKIPKQFKQFIIDEVTKSENYFKTYISKTFKRHIRKGECGDSFVEIARTVKDILMDILENIHISADLIEDFQAFCDLGIVEIIQQLNGQKTMDIASLFKTAVFEAVSNSSFQLWNRFQLFEGNLEQTIFFDQNFYFFPESVFQAICDNLFLGKHNVRLLKHKLYEMGVLIAYSFQNSKFEFKKDIWYKTDIKLQRISGYALRCEFWDQEIGMFPLSNLSRNAKK